MPTRVLRPAHSAAGGRERPEILECFARHAKPLPFAFQPETHRASGCGVATRASVSDQRARVDTRHQIERVEKLFRASGQIVTVEQIRDGARERRHRDLHPQPIDRRHAVGLGRGRPGEPSRGLHEPAGQAVRLEHARLSRGDDLHVVPFRVGVAVQLQGRVIGDDAARAQPRRRQEAVNGPTACVRVLEHRREDLAGDAPDVARLEMLGKHCRHDPVARLSADGGGVLGPADAAVRIRSRIPAGLLGCHHWPYADSAPTRCGRSSARAEAAPSRGPGRHSALRARVPLPRPS